MLPRVGVALPAIAAGALVAATAADDQPVVDTGVSSSRSEPQIEARSARNAVAHRYAGAMRPDDLHDDRQTQPGAAAANSLAAPEALEDVRTILQRDARPAVQNT